MLAYYLVLAYFVIGALFAVERGTRPLSVAGQPAAAGRSGIGGGPLSFGLWAGALLLVLFIGFRFEVGGDWQQYVLYWKRAAFGDLGELSGLGDPGYQFLNWLAQRLGLEVWSVNLACAALFSWGLIRLASTQPFPWLVVVVAIPYLVIVVAMGYTRQGVAIGLLMAGLAALLRGASLWHFAIYAILATTFHKTAVLALPLVIFSIRRNRVASVVGGIALLYGLYAAFLAQDVDKLVRNYIEARYQSEGALIRLALAFLPATIFLFFWRRLEFTSDEQRFWRLSCYAALAMMAAFPLVASTTAIDRMALYLFPLQLVVLGRIPLLLPGMLGKLAVILYSLAIQVVWLNYATHAKAWLPYQNILLG